MQWTLARQYRVLAAAVCVALILPRIAQPGMFVDGVTYAVLARNLAAGLGSFWSPFFSTSVYPVFHEQPPLGIGLEAIAFAVLGDHLYVERLFSVLIFALTAMLMVALWRRVLPKEYDWLPLFFWILPSIVTWGAINNMLEGIQAVFTTAAVVLIVYGATTASRTRAVLCSAAAGVAVVAACLVKGPVGLFPLAVPPLAWMLGGAERRQLRRIAGVWITLAVATAIVSFGVLAMDEARFALSEFTRTHVVPSLQGDRGLPRRSADIARHFSLGILARMAALAALLWIIRPRERHPSRVQRKVVGFFLAAGLVASVPLLASPVLAGHYFLPSVPLFALGVAAAALPAIQAFGELSRTRRRFIPLAIATGLAIVSIAVLIVRGPMERRDVELINGLRTIGGHLPRHTTIGTCEAAAADWGLHGYAQRFFGVSLAATGSANGGWLLVRKDACQAPSGCVPEAESRELKLFRCPE